jgi:hypothetical protein
MATEIRIVGELLMLDGSTLEHLDRYFTALALPAHRGRS